MNQWTLTPDDYRVLYTMHNPQFPVHPLHLRSSFALADDARRHELDTCNLAGADNNRTLMNAFAALANPALRIDINGRADTELRITGCHNHYTGVLVHQLPDPTPHTSGNLIVTICQPTDLITRLYECLPSYPPGRHTPLTLTDNTIGSINNLITQQPARNEDTRQLQQLLNHGVLGAGYFTVTTSPQHRTSFGWIDVNTDGRYLSFTHPITKVVTITSATSQKFTHHIHHLTRALNDT